MSMLLPNYVNNSSYKMSFAFQPGLQKFGASFWEKASIKTHSTPGPSWKQGWELGLGGWETIGSFLQSLLTVNLDLLYLLNF